MKTSTILSFVFILLVSISSCNQSESIQKENSTIESNSPQSKRTSMEYIDPFKGCVELNRLVGPSIGGVNTIFPSDILQLVYSEDVILQDGKSASLQLFMDTNLPSNTFKLYINKNLRNDIVFAQKNVKISLGDDQTKVNRIEIPMICKTDKRYNEKEHKEVLTLSLDNFKKDKYIYDISVIDPSDINKNPLGPKTITTRGRLCGGNFIKLK